MTRITAIFVVALLGLSLSPAHACLGDKRIPQAEDLRRYSDVRVVEVTGVHLTEYEAYQLMRRGARPWPKPQGDLEYIYPTSSTAGFEVQALVDQTIKGLPASTKHFMLGGCAVVPPKLHERGIVFLEPGSDFALAVWQSEGAPYRRLARALGVMVADEP
jgi:hypothetical protein